MKNTTVILLLLVSIMISCNDTKKHVGDRILEQTKVKFGKLNETKLGDGTILYSFSYIGSDYFEKKKEIKNSIDKQLNILPAKSNEDKFDHLCRCSDSSYSWETPEIKIDLTINDSFATNKDSIYVRYWIYKK
jgi:hypothetical protein